jgi:hypothetical protein
MVSDLVPIGGYHKSSYIVIVSTFGTLAFFLLATVKLKPANAVNSTWCNGTGSGVGFLDAAIGGCNGTWVAAATQTVGGAGGIATLLFMLAHVQIAMVDLLTEGE